MTKLSLLICVSIFSLNAQTHPLEAIIEAARAKSPALKDLVTKAVPNMKTQGAAFVWGQDFVFAIESEKPASISIDHRPAVAMDRLADSNVWYRLVKMRVGVTHEYEFQA